MNKHRADHEESVALRARLAEAEEMLTAIREGEIDALVVEGPSGSQVYTLHSDDEPYRHLVEGMPEGAVVLTSRGDILYANARFAALAAEPLESVVGSRVERFIDPAGRSEFERFLQGGHGRCRNRLIASGVPPIEVSLSLTTTGSSIGVRRNLIVTDLGELVAANSGRVRAERDSRTKDEFLAMMAHELRTPLGAISSAVRVLEATVTEDVAAGRARDVIRRQVGHVTHLIGDLLDVERVVSGKTRLHRQPLDLARAVRQALETFTADAQIDRRFEISTEPLWVDGDAERLEQVLANLVTNAVKYTSPGASIRVSLRADGDDAVVTIDDDGLGISARVLPFIFDLYVQADRTLDSAQGGLGIGLTLVRRLIEQHGGTIAAASGGEGQGSRFTVRLKQVPPAGAPTSVPAARERRTKPRRVLLIEDNRDAREMLRMMLELSGHLVYDAADGATGLELLKVMRPDVGIIDIGLPRMDGYELAREIRELPQGRGMLLLALTGYGGADDVRRAVEHGFDHHLVKPVDPDLLTRLMNAGAAA